MIVEKRISFVRLAKLIWREMLCVLLVATAPVFALIYLDLAHYAINASIPLIIGTAIAIFLGFRTNSAYDRWWEGRKLWGGIINDCRNLVRLSRDFLGSDDGNPQVQEICYRQIAWAHVLGQTLKNAPWQDRAESLLSAQDFQRVNTAKDPGLMLLTLQGDSVAAAHRGGQIDSHQFILLEQSISRLCDHYGGCQRIKNTVFPVHYSFFTRVFIWIFLGLLGFSLPAHENANYFLIPAIVLIGWVFLMVEGIGSYMQDPFENNRNVIPMDAMSVTIETNLREMIGEQAFPPPVQPIDGALY